MVIQEMIDSMLNDAAIVPFKPLQQPPKSGPKPVSIPQNSLNKSETLDDDANFTANTESCSTISAF
eukprot:1986680-Amphidinium_carterae.1